MTTQKWPNRKIVSFTLYVGYGEEGLRRFKRIKDELKRRSLSLSAFAMAAMEEKLGIVYKRGG